MSNPAQLAHPTLQRSSRFVAFVTNPALHDAMARVGFMVYLAVCMMIAITGLKSTYHDFGLLATLPQFSVFMMLFSMSLVAFLTDSFPIKLLIGAFVLVGSMTF